MSGDPVVSDSALAVFASLLQARTGQHIAANRAWRLDTALRPLLRERGLDTLDQLISLLLDGQDRTIGDRVVDALLNQETSFFRDAAVLDLIAEAGSAIGGDRRLRIWSAGCSNGQEALSLAMLFAERCGANGTSMPEIVATDVSEGAIARARAGRYNQFEIQRGLPIRRMIRWFDAADADWAAKPELLQRVAYRRHNLVADAPPPGRFNIVLCRNVLMYLVPGLRRQVFARIAQALAPGGLLVLGAGETVIGQTDALVPSRRFRGLYEAAAVSPALRVAAR